MDKTFGLILLVGAVAVGAYLLKPSPPPPPVKETAASKCISRVAGQYADAMVSRLDYLSKHPKLFLSPENKLAERREREAYCAKEAACMSLDEADTPRKKTLYDLAFLQCLEDEKRQD